MCDYQEPKAASAAAPADKPVDLTKPVQTRDGRAVRILCTDRKHSDHPVVALVKCHDFQERCYSFGPDGRHLVGLGRDLDLDLDLVNVPPKVISEGCYNVYSPGVIGSRFLSVQAAKREAWPSAIGIIKLTAYNDGSFTVEKVED